MNSVEALAVALDAIRADIRGVKFSKVYRLGLPGPVARLDKLEHARETLEALRDMLAEPHKYANEHQVDEAYEAARADLLP